MSTAIFKTTLVSLPIISSHTYGSKITLRKYILKNFHLNDRLPTLSQVLLLWKAFNPSPWTNHRLDKVLLTHVLMLIFTCKVAHLCEHVLQTYHPLSDNYRRDFTEKGTSCAAQLYVCFCTSPYTGSLHSCQHCYQFLNQLKIKPVLLQGNLLHLPAQVLVAGVYRSGWPENNTVSFSGKAIQALPQLTKDYWRVTPSHLYNLHSPTTFPVSAVTFSRYPRKWS